MKQINVINFIEVPEGMEEIAVEVREAYVDYFRKQSGFVSSTFYRWRFQAPSANNAA